MQRGVTVNHALTSTVPIDCCDIYEGRASGYFVVVQAWPDFPLSGEVSSVARLRIPFTLSIASPDCVNIFLPVLVEACIFTVHSGNIKGFGFWPLFLSLLCQ